MVVRGMDHERLELQQTLLEARASQLDVVFRRYIAPTVKIFNDVADALNQVGGLGGDVIVEERHLGGPIVTTHSEYKTGGRSTQDFLEVRFPNGRKWDVPLLSLCINPDTPDDFDEGLNLWVKGDGLQANIFLLKDGNYRFQVREPRDGWPEDLLGESGGLDFLTTVVKALYEREVKLGRW